MEQNINQLRKEIEECPNTPEASQEELELNRGLHCDTCAENYLKLQTLQEVCEEIEEDIKLQKTELKDEKNNFGENKPPMWRIHGFQSLLSKITGKEIKLFDLSEKEEIGE